MSENISTEIPTIEEEKVAEEMKKEIDPKEITELEAPIKKIIDKIKDRIEGGEYGLIIGDDASGRIPALILGNFIREISEKRGLEKPNIIFIPSKLDDEAKKDKLILEDHLKKWGAVEDKKILIITDSVMFGISLSTLVTMLKKLGYECEIVTIGLEEPIRGFLDRKLLLGFTKIISGDYEDDRNKEYPHTPRVYKSESSGVVNRKGDYSSTPNKLDDRRRNEHRRKHVVTSREQGDILTDRLVDWYLNKHE